jgi:hypothetical protein
VSVPGHQSFRHCPTSMRVLESTLEMKAGDLRGFICPKSSLLCLWVEWAEVQRLEPGGRDQVEVLEVKILRCSFHSPDPFRKPVTWVLGECETFHICWVVGLL